MGKVQEVKNPSLEFPSSKSEEPKTKVVIITSRLTSILVMTPKYIDLMKKHKDNICWKRKALKKFVS